MLIQWFRRVKGIEAIFALCQRLDGADWLTHGNLIRPTHFHRGYLQPIFQPETQGEGNRLLAVGNCAPFAPLYIYNAGMYHPNGVTGIQPRQQV